MTIKKPEVKVVDDCEEIDVVEKYLNSDIKLPQEVADRLNGYSSFRGFIPLYKYLTEVTGKDIRIDSRMITDRASSLVVRTVNSKGNTQFFISMNIMGFPSCCGMALGHGLAPVSEENLYDYKQRGYIQDNFSMDTVVKLFGYGLAAYYRAARVTKFIYTVSEQEYTSQERLLRAMGFYDYSEPFVSCRTHHKLQTLVLDCYTDEEMRSAEQYYKATFASKRLYT